jgi:hypothetical protein
MQKVCCSLCGPKACPPDAMTQVLEQLDQAGTPIIQQE